MGGCWSSARTHALKARRYYLVQIADAGSVPCSATTLPRPTSIGWAFSFLGSATPRGAAGRSACATPRRHEARKPIDSKTTPTSRRPRWCAGCAMRRSAAPCRSSRSRRLRVCDRRSPL